MSLLLRDRVFIALAPERLAALRVAGRFRPRIEERHELPVPAANGAQWDTLMTALEDLLEQPGWAACDLTLILSSHYVFCAVIPGSHGLAAVEQSELAHLVFRNIYGELSDEWVFRVSPSRGMPTLASAVPRSTLKALHDACDGRGRLRSIQPGLMAVFNGVRPLIEKNTGTLALVEPGRTSLAVFENGLWQSVASRAGRSGGLAQLLDEESELHGRRPGGTLWLCDLTGEVRLPSASPWQLHRLKPRHGAGSASASLAEWGVP